MSAVTVDKRIHTNISMATAVEMMEVYYGYTAVGRMHRRRFLDGPRATQVNLGDAFISKTIEYVVFDGPQDTFDTLKKEMRNEP
jgi:hypothetical protein